MRLETLQTLLALAVMFRMIGHLLDAMNTYIGSKLDKLILMRIPDGVDPLGLRSLFICELLKSLYGLKQSGHLWNQKLTGFLVNIGFKPTTVDLSIFINE